MHVCMYVDDMYTHIAYMYVCTCVHVCICVCYVHILCVCVCVYMYKCVIQLLQEHRDNAVKHTNAANTAETVLTD